MKLFNEKQYQKLLENGSDPGKDHAPVVRVHLPFTQCVWLLSELDPENTDICFGLCDLGMGFPELGYVSIQEIIAEGKDVLGIIPECDDTFEGLYPMSVYQAAARSKSKITTDENLLKQYAPTNKKGPTPKP